jgi:hypothetical protein
MMNLVSGTIWNIGSGHDFVKVPVADAPVMDQLSVVRTVRLLD